MQRLSPIPILCCWCEPVNYISELKRRNVIRMAGLYLVGAWLITQVAATLLTVFEAPGWVMNLGWQTRKTPFEFT